MNEGEERGKKEDKRGQKKKIPVLFFSVPLPLSPSLSRSYTEEIVDQVNGEIDKKTEDRESEQMERQSTSQQRDEEKKEQKTKDKSKYSSGLRCLQSVCGRGDWLLPVVPLPRLPSAFFFLSSQKRLPIQMTKKRRG